MKDMLGGQKGKALTPVAIVVVDVHEIAAPILRWLGQAARSPEQTAVGSVRVDAQPALSTLAVNPGRDGQRRRRRLYLLLDRSSQFGRRELQCAVVSRF